MTLITFSDPLEQLIGQKKNIAKNLPIQPFGSGGKAGKLKQAVRIGYITGKYIYKYHKKLTGFGGGLTGIATYLLTADDSPGNGQIFPPPGQRITPYTSDKTRGRPTRRNDRRYRTKCPTNPRIRYS